MSKKKIVLSIVLSVFAVANVVLYLIFKEQYIDTLKYLYGLMNEPLPIVGVTSVAVLIFLWKVIITARYGQGNINKIKAEYEKEKEELYSELKEYNELIESQKDELKKLQEYFTKLCSTIRNKKVRELGEEYYGREETINSEAKTE